MKFLKLYESFDKNPKFKVGNYVRIVNDSYPDGWQSEPYKIIDSLPQSQFYQLKTVDGYIYRHEKNLILVPDYEINAIKYNL